MNETLKTLLERRSVRGYKDDLVPAEVLDQILEAGEYAPSGMGKQGTLMVVTQNPELVKKLSATQNHSATETSPKENIVSSPFSSLTFRRPSGQISSASAFRTEVPSVIVIWCPRIILCAT